MDITIKDIPDEIANLLKVRAAESGVDRMTYLREQLVRLAAQPTIRKRYKFTALGDGGAKVTIKREIDFVSQGASNCSQAQFDAFQKAVLYCQRNEAGDYEAAYKLLVENFDEVFPG